MAAILSVTVSRAGGCVDDRSACAALRCTGSRSATTCSRTTACPYTALRAEADSRGTIDTASRQHELLRQTAGVTAASDDDAAIAARIVSMHGGTAEEVIALPGVVNRVFRVTGPTNDWVIRYPSDERRTNEFPVEIWAAHQASL